MISLKCVRKYCRDDISKIENYEKAIADTTQTWQCHHRLELTLDGEPALSRDQLMMHDMYYNRPYYELIFLTPSEHSRLHGINMSDESRRKISDAKKGNTIWLGKHHSEETKLKMSESHKGKSTWNKGKHHSDETRKKMSDAAKGKHHSEAARLKMSESHKGKHHSEETRLKMSESRKGKKFSEETRRKMSESHKRKKF